MTAFIIVIVGIVLLLLGYVFYGSYLAKQWGIDVKRKTPANEMYDGMDYVAAKPAVLMGHHYSSIAGSGPINGPIQAAVFGWVPVFLWCVIGGIFFGGVQDFGSLFASVRNKGKSVGEIIEQSMGKKAKTLFMVFALLALILALASFVNVVAGTFFTPEGGFGVATHPTSNQATAMISVLFIVIALIYGFITNRLGLKTLPATIIGIVCIVGIIIIGLNVGIVMSRTSWIVFLGLYTIVASLVPVWIMLQPRDYLSSFLLYAMMLVALFGIIMNAFRGSAAVAFSLPAFTSWNTHIGPLFPALFITVSCAACSGFHALIATGTTSKQLDNEVHAKPIAYGSMLIESVLGIISMIAVGIVWDAYKGSSFSTSPASVFGAGIALLFGAEGSPSYNTINALLTLAVSVFALTSMDTGARLIRYFFGELFLHEDERTWRDAKGVRRVLAHPFFGTLIIVAISCVLGGLRLSQIWSLFGAANQLLAGIALMAVAAWLGEVSKNNKMFFFPMVFMLLATLTSLVMTAISKIAAMASGAEGAFVWASWFQLLFALAMVVLAVFLIIEGIQTFAKQLKKRA